MLGKLITYYKDAFNLKTFLFKVQKFLGVREPFEVRENIKIFQSFAIQYFGIF